MIKFSDFNFAPVMNYPADITAVDLSGGYNSGALSSIKWGAGGYNEKREGMYLADHFEGKRNIHMGIDIWAQAGEAVYAFYEGRVVYMRDNDRKGDYGGTIITLHQVGRQKLFALYGHLSKASLTMVTPNQHVSKGDKIAELGTEQENGGWVPHLHFQLSVDDPGEADMPGVVAEENHQAALKTYPDPRLVLGNLY